MKEKRERESGSKAMEKKVKENGLLIGTSYTDDNVRARQWETECFLYFNKLKYANVTRKIFGDLK